MNSSPWSAIVPNKTNIVKTAGKVSTLFPSVKVTIIWIKNWKLEIYTIAAMYLASFRPFIWTFLVLTAINRAQHRRIAIIPNMMLIVIVRKLGTRLQM